MNQEFISNSAEETKKIAAEFSKNLKPGDIIALYGELGAGKTTFIQGLVESLGYKGKVFSPTFIFVRPYPIGDQTSDISRRKYKIKTFYHIDLYRIEKPADLKTIGVEEFLNEKDAVSAVEWPDKIEKELPSKATKIKIEGIDETKRKITVNG